jgi:hypothetical protein
MERLDKFRNYKSGIGHTRLPGDADQADNRGHRKYRPDPAPWMIFLALGP